MSHDNRTPRLFRSLTAKSGAAPQATFLTLHLQPGPGSEDAWLVNITHAPATVGPRALLSKASDDLFSLPYLKIVKDLHGLKKSKTLFLEQRDSQVAQW